MNFKVKMFSEQIAVVSAAANIIICRIEAPRMQYLISTMRTFLKQASPNERELIQDYVDKCLMPHVIALVIAIVVPCAFIMRPLLTKQPFPGDVAYPFSIEAYWIWATLYVLQSICAVI